MKTIQSALLILILGCLSMKAMATSWELSLEYPDHEKKVFNVPNNEIFFLKLDRKSKWACAIATDQIDKDGIYKTIGCRYDSNKAGSIVTAVCMGPKQYPALLTLTESDGKKTHVLALTCAP